MWATMDEDGIAGLRACVVRQSAHFYWMCSAYTQPYHCRACAEGAGCIEGLRRNRKAHHRQLQRKIVTLRPDPKSKGNICIQTRYSCWSWVSMAISRLRLVERKVDSAWWMLPELCAGTGWRKGGIPCHEPCILLHTQQAWGQT